MKSPRVGITVSSFGKYPFLRETLHSALAQKYPRQKVDVLVVEDGAENREKAKKAFEDAIRSAPSSFTEVTRSAHLIITDRNCGTPKSRNIGMDTLIANGSELITHLDGDDLLHPEFSIALSRKLAEVSFGRAVSFSHVFAFEDGNLQLSDILNNSFGHLVKPFGNRQDLYCSVWMMPAAIYQEVGGYHEWMSERWEDAEFVDDLVVRQVPSFPTGTFYFYRLGSVLEARKRAQEEQAALLWAKRYILHPTAPELVDKKPEPELYEKLQRQTPHQNRRCAGKVKIELIPAFGPIPKLGKSHG